jgi:hypothetical protein
MVFAAARAAVQARIRRKAILAKTKNMVEVKIDEDQKSDLTALLKESDSTVFLTNMLDGRCFDTS